MIGIFKKNNIAFKVGSMEWLNFFGLGHFLIVIGLIFLFFEFKDSNNHENFNTITASIICILFGILLFLNQSKKLKFEEFPFNKEPETFREEILQLLQTENWEIEYNNKKGIQAVNRESVFSLDMITVRIFNSKVLLNVIHHPESHNSIAAHFSLNRKGKSVIEKIKASA